MKRSSAKAPSSILILRALQLGDLLCAVPALRALRGAYPHARVTLVGLPWAQSFVERFSAYLDDFIEFPGWPGLPETAPQLERIPAFLQEMQARQFDLAVQMHGAGTITNPILALSRAKKLAGYYLPGQFCPSNETFWPYPEGEHEIRIWTQLAEALGAPPQGEQLEFPITEQEREIFAAFHSAHGLGSAPYAILHAGARDAARRWPIEKFAAVGDSLVERGLRVVLTGSEAEKALTQELAQRMAAPALNTAGQTDLGTLALLIANARVLVSNDTGVSHIAATFATPSVILFSTSDPQRWRPLNQQIHRGLMDFQRITLQDVLAEIDAASANAKASAYA